ncbi:MAG: diacylglycerol kinase family lipid kinase [Acidobacteriota bacterium]|nr:diacylglycerol kinase family lipid kinase [Acidobacteriota bacterium]MDW3228634.1 diacylglycerol kinase family lipid kinase [Acidobacteriota bacterium]MDY0231452.1 diacylglycerol kinase family lipid kinase [Candidatus Saccharicenans sp.]
MKPRLLKTRVIVNPASDRGRTRHRWLEIKENLKSFFKEFKYDFTEKPQQATDLAREAIKEGAELLIGVGGDGTANEIANGFFSNQKIINPEATLGIVPSGTGCDLIRSLNIPRNLKNAVRFISEAPDQHIDLGQVTYTGPEGQTASRYYLNIADFGLGGEVVKKVNEQRLKRRASSYVRCLAEVMLSFKGYQVKISVDGQEKASDNYLIGAIANGQVFGKGMKIAPLARLDDSFFDIILVKSLKFIELCLQGWKLISGSHLSHRQVSFTRGKRVQVTSLYLEPVLVELDGEQVGTLPALFEIIPRSFKTKGFIKRS